MPEANFNKLTITALGFEYAREIPDCLLVHEWQVTAEGVGVFFVTNTDMVYYECHDESGERIVASDSLDGIITFLLEYRG